MKTPKLVLLSLPLVLLLPLSALAQGIGHVTTVNLSDADASRTDGNGSFEFSTLATATAPLSDGHVASFTHRMAWYGGLISSSPASYDTAASEVPEVGYLLRFTIFDPGNIGYTLQLQGRLAGALWAGTDGTATALAALRAFTVRFADGGGVPAFTELPDLATRAQDAVVTTPDTFEERVVDDAGRARVGDYTGSRDFVVAVRADPQWLSMTAPPAAEAQSHMQFGIAPTMPELFGGLYTGPGGRSIDKLGHFLDVSVEFHTVPTVPEPGSWALLAAGMGVLLLRLRRQRRATDPDA